MKFTCSQRELSKALNIVSKAVSIRTTIPILKGIKLELKENTLLLSASDLDLSIENSIKVNMIEKGSTVVPAKLFGDIIRKLPNEEITIEEAENNIIIINSSKSKFEIVCFNTDEFPNIKGEEKILNIIKTDRKIFRDMISKTSFAAATEEARGIITGILLEVNEESLTMVALDGFRMAITKAIMKNSSSHNFVISAKILNEINKIIMESEEDGEITISFGEKKAFIQLDTTYITLKMLEGGFMNYKKIIPENETTTVLINKSDFIGSMERASLISKESKKNLIRINIKNNLLTLTSRSEEGNVKEEIIIEKEGNDIEIGFDSKYMIAALKAIDEEYVKIEMTTNTKAALVKPTQGDFCEYLVMPVRIPSI